ncbi:MAG: hypothetical protein V1755_05590 [Chloroflexota bacterium]
MLDHLSKHDFEGLGCEDISGPQLRARVFHLEAAVAGLALALEGILADVDSGRASLRHAVTRPAREALETARELCGKPAGERPAK